MAGQMKKLLLISILLITFGCQTTEESGMQRRDLQRYYVSSGIERFFLPDIPEWINVSETANCKRESDIKFINLPKLQNNFRLKYSEALQFQYFLSRERTAKKQFYNSKFLMLKDEEIIFYDVSDKIQSGIYAFKPPKFNRVNLVWIDPAIGSKEKFKELAALMRSREMDLGHPVFVSMCLDHQAMKAFFKRSKAFSDNILMIPFDLFSIYNSNKEQQLFFSIEVESLFRSKQELHFYSPDKVVPKEIIGKFITHKY